MRRVYSLLISAAIIAAASIAATGAETESESAEKAADLVESSVQETDAVPRHIAERVAFSDLRDGDRFVIMWDSTDDENCMRVISSVMYFYNFAGVQARGTDEYLTYIPKQTAVFTLEDAGDDGFYLRTDGEYLTVDPFFDDLYTMSEYDEDSLWELRDEKTLVHQALPEKSDSDEEQVLYDVYLCYSDSGRVFTTEVPDEDNYTDPSGCFMRFYKLSDDYQVKTDAGGGYRLPLIETSDIHGHLVDTSEDEYLYRYAWIADRIRDMRSMHGQYREDSSILLDGGDIFQGDILSNLLAGEPVSEVFAMMNYDAVTIGNHEFDWGIGNVIDSDRTMMDYEKDGEIQTNSTPVIISDLYKDGEKVDFADDYIILEKTAVNDEGSEIPVRVAVIGFADDYSGSIMYDKFTGAGYEIREDYDALAEEAEALKEKEQCDAVILLAHADASETAKKLSSDSEIDLLLGGHVHVNDVGENEQGVAYLMPAGDGKAYCYAELVFDLDENGEVQFRDVEADRTVGIRPGEMWVDADKWNEEYLDVDIITVCDEAIDKLDKILEEEIGYITVSSDRYDYFPESGERGSTGGNWYCSITARAADADVGFINRYGMRADVIVYEDEDSAGIRKADIYDMFPFNNHLYCFELTMEELKALIEYSLTEHGSELFTMMTGIDCYYSGQTINALLKDGELLYLNGEWTGDHADDKIRVGVSEYLVTSGGEESVMPNPLMAWKDTERVLSSDVIDVEGALKVLREEAAENDGKLDIDTHSCFICGEYPE